MKYLYSYQDEIVEEWMKVVIPNEEFDIVFFDSASIQAHLTHFTNQIIEYLFTESVKIEQLQIIGEGLSELTAGEPEILGRTQELLMGFFFEKLSSEQISVLRPHLFTLLRELAIGFVLEGTRRIEELEGSIQGLNLFDDDISKSINDLQDANQSLQDECRKPEYVKMHQYTQQIADEVKNLLYLVGDFLEILGRRHKDLILHPETIDVATAIQDSIKTMQPVIDKTSITLQVDYDKDIGCVEADELRLQQILLNLLSNAYKFTEQGTISFNVYRERKVENEFVIFKVTDTGIGIAPEKQSYLFLQPIHSHRPSLGLGLSVSYRLCQMMGGNLTVESEVGKGTTFRAYLPVKQKSTS